MKQQRKFQAELLPKPSVLKLFEELNPKLFNVLELGAGVGRHSIQYAQSHPQHVFYGVEHSKERFGKFERRIESHREKGIDLLNLHAIHADGEAFVAHCVPPQSLDRVYFLYPNPYPKKSQANKRWHNMPFFDFLLTRLKAGAELVLATNEEFYFQEALELAQKHSKLEIVSQKKWDRESEPSFLPRTHFEKKYFLSGQVLFELRFRENSTS